MQLSAVQANGRQTIEPKGSLFKLKNQFEEWAWDEDWTPPLIRMLHWPEENRKKDIVKLENTSTICTS